ncbi:hypothetical protein [Massilia sp. PWRC2]|uniref:hypothetical protein n=1 Tax=Massilia sp. PWRC2 TaxID=2804626 RepID=UPI003CEA5FA4
MQCAALLPAWCCGHGELLLHLLVYLLPSAALAVLFAILARLHPLFFVLTFAGTVCHELAHVLVGLLVGARPRGVSLLPKKVSGAGGRLYWQLGSVTLSHLRWYNAAPAALAPLLLLLVPLAVAFWRTRDGWHFGAVDLGLALLLAPQWLSFWPSAPDWRIAARSWPYGALMVLVALACSPGCSLFHLVKN